MLSIMIAPLAGAPAFVDTLLPVYGLSTHFFYKHVQKVIELLHSCSGFCLALMSDNYGANQKCFSMFKSNFGSSKTPPITPSKM